MITLRERFPTYAEVESYINNAKRIYNRLRYNYTIDIGLDISSVIGQIYQDVEHIEYVVTVKYGSKEESRL